MATIYRTVVQIKVSDNVKRTFTKEFSNEEDAKASLKKDIQVRADEQTPDTLKTGDVFNIEKVPATYALLSLNSELFDDYPTDLIGQFDTFDKAVQAGKSIINDLINDQTIAVDVFPDYTILAIFLVPTDGFVDYWDGCSWSFEFVDGKLSVKEDK